MPGQVPAGSTGLWPSAPPGARMDPARPRKFSRSGWEIENKTGIDEKRGPGKHQDRVSDRSQHSDQNGNQDLERLVLCVYDAYDL